MNKMRRRQIANAIKLIEQATEILEQVMDDEQDALDSLPENLQGPKRAEAMEDYIYTIEDFLDTLDTDELQEIVDQ